MTRERVHQMLKAGASVTEIATTLALAKSTVCYHARRLGYPAQPKYGRRYDWDEIRGYYEAGHSVKECQERFGFTISAWCDAIERGDVVPIRRGFDLQAYLARRDNCRLPLKKRLLAEGVKRNICERCGISRWRGKPLSIALHHVNGDAHDNRLQNLQLLCPNCHSQTENYGGRNKGRAGQPRGERRSRAPTAPPGRSPRRPAPPGPGWSAPR